MILDWVLGRPSALERIEWKVMIMGLNVERLVQEVSEINTVTASAVTLIEGISTELAALRQALADQPAVQAQIDALVDQLDSGAARLAAAVEANTPAAPAG